MIPAREAARVREAGAVVVVEVAVVAMEEGVAVEEAAEAETKLQFSTLRTKFNSCELPELRFAVNTAFPVTARHTTHLTMAGERIADFVCVISVTAADRLWAERMAAVWALLEQGLAAAEMVAARGNKSGFFLAWTLRSNFLKLPHRFSA